jgi:hypothetical protein
MVKNDHGLSTLQLTLFLHDGSRKFGWLKAKRLEADVVIIDKVGAFFKGLLE